MFSRNESNRKNLNSKPKSSRFRQEKHVKKSHCTDSLRHCLKGTFIDQVKYGEHNKFVCFCNWGRLYTLNSSAEGHHFSHRQTVFINIQCFCFLTIDWFENHLQVSSNLSTNSINQWQHMRVYDKYSHEKWRSWVTYTLYIFV